MTIEKSSVKTYGGVRVNSQYRKSAYMTNSGIRQASEEQTRSFESMSRTRAIFDTDGNIYVKGDEAKKLLDELGIKHSQAFEMRTGTHEVNRTDLSIAFGAELISQKFPQNQI